MPNMISYSITNARNAKKRGEQPKTYWQRDKQKMLNAIASVCERELLIPDTDFILSLTARELFSMFFSMSSYQQGYYGRTSGKDVPFYSVDIDKLLKHARRIKVKK